MNRATAAQRVPAGPLAGLEPGQVRRLEAVDPPVAVYNLDGDLFCVDDTCTHESYPLSEGWFEDGEIECALHGARFCVETGEALCLPANRDLRVHEVEVVDGEIFVTINQEA